MHLRQGVYLVSLIDSCHAKAGAYTQLARLLCQASVKTPAQKRGPENVTLPQLTKVSS